MGSIGILIARDHRDLPKRTTLEIGGVRIVDRILGAMKESSALDDIRVISDNPELEPMVRSREHAFLRVPVSLSGSDTRMEELVRYTLGDSAADWIYVLTLDCPFLIPGDISTAKFMAASGKYHSVVAVTPESSDVMKQLRSGRKGIFHEDTAKRQVYTKLGSLIATNAQYFKESYRLVSKRSGILSIPRERSIKLDSGWGFLAAQAFHEEFSKVGYRPSEPKHK